MAADAVQSISTVVKIQPGPQGPVVTDGPFAETKEQLGGFYVIEAQDRDEVMTIAARIHSARLATVEVWPLKDLAALQEARLAPATATH